MSLNTLPIEVLERIFELAGVYYGTFYCKASHKDDLKRFALVYRKWARIAMPMIWREIKVSGLGRREKSNAFKFYRHILAHSCGRHIRKLKLKTAPFWAICIVKILQACPYIQEFQLWDYYDNSDKGKIDL